VFAYGAGDGSSTPSKGALLITAPVAALMPTEFPSSFFTLISSLIDFISAVSPYRSTSQRINKTSNECTMERSPLKAAGRI
jgi:hypothetical protein